MKMQNFKDYFDIFRLKSVWFECAAISRWKKSVCPRKAWHDQATRINHKIGTSRAKSPNNITTNMYETIFE